MIYVLKGYYIIILLSSMLMLSQNIFDIENNKLNGFSKQITDMNYKGKILTQILSIGVHGYLMYVLYNCTIIIN